MAKTEKTLTKTEKIASMYMNPPVDILAETNLLKKLIAQWKTCPVGRFTSMQIVLYAVLEYLGFDPERVYKITNWNYLNKHSEDWILNVFMK